MLPWRQASFYNSSLSILVISVLINSLSSFAYCFDFVAVGLQSGIKLIKTDVIISPQIFRDGLGLPNSISKQEFC